MLGLRRRGRDENDWSIYCAATEQVFCAGDVLDCERGIEGRVQRPWRPDRCCRSIVRAPRYREHHQRLRDSRGALTIFSNVTGFFTFAKWVRDIFEHWRLIVHGILRSVLNLLPISVPDEFIGPMFVTLVTLSLAVGARVSGGPPSIRFTKRVVNAMFAMLFTSVFGFLAMGFTQLSRLFNFNATIVNILIAMPISLFLINQLDRRGISGSDAVAVACVCAVVIAMTGWPPILSEAWLAVLLGPFSILVARSEALTSRAFWTGGLVLLFAAVALSTLLPIPEGLMISEFFAK
jgi:hypothetical protein